MLATLRIRNLALVPDLTIDLHPGLNVVTGETGAGKSVILGAIQLVIGQRADRGAIRAGADQCSVEAVFHTSRCQQAINTVLESAGLDPCENGELVIRRSFSASGMNRQFVNGSPTTLSTLASLGEWLVDLHGPHDHQSLLQPSRQLAILDAFGGLGPLRESFGSAVLTRASLRQQLDELGGDEATLERHRDLLQHQVQEIEAARLRPGEEESLAADHTRASHSARLLELSTTVMAALSEDDDSISHRMSAIGRLLGEMARLDPSAEHAADLYRQAETILHELHLTLDRHTQTLDFNPRHLAELSERLNLVQSLRRKYGNTTQDILNFAAKAREDLLALDGRGQAAESLRQELERIDQSLASMGSALGQRRKDVAPALARAAATELSALGFRQSGFTVSIQPAVGHDSPATAGTSGMDQCEFLFAPNPGEPHRPLRSIASSGELARVMLSLKAALAAQDDVPVLVFDEVDANVGGETAHAVGERLRRIAHDHQVLCISHLAPVAAHAQAHFLVSKSVHASRTESRIEQLDEQGRTAELGRMLGGGPAALRHAQDLMAATRKTTS